MAALTFIINTLALVVVWSSLLYFLVVFLAGFRDLRRRRLPLSVQAATRYELPHAGSPGTFECYVLIPCLNESAVIGATVAMLTGDAHTTVIVVDDGSDDDTAAAAASAGDRQTIVLRRELPDARQGKGAALNHGFTFVERCVRERGQDPDRVLVVVMDADGRLSDAAFSHVLPLFEDPEVGGVQLAVRIRNRDTNFLTRFQDFQFWSMAAIAQFGRNMTGTVSLGGNGQFTRFSALAALGATPWSASLTEDLDLAVTLATRGWVLQTTPNASVDQQGVTGLRRLFVQRRRWYQGHMMSGERIREVWTAPALRNTRAVEMVAYLLVPWLIDLPWSLLWHWNLVLMIINAGALFSELSDAWSIVAVVILWYLITFAPTLLTALVYIRRDPRQSILNALLLAHSFLVMNYLFFACAWAALFRIVRGHRGWDKTARTHEAASRPATMT